VTTDKGAGCREAAVRWEVGVINPIGHGHGSMRRGYVNQS
jgi:hypothetical protein